MFGLQEVVFAAMEFLQLCRNGGRTRSFLLEEVLPATLPPRIQDGCRTFRRLHVQKPPRTHRFGSSAFSDVPTDSRLPLLGAELIMSVVRQGGWWVWPICRVFQPTFHTCGTPAPQYAAPPRMAQCERGTSKQSVHCPTFTSSVLVFSLPS